LIAPTMVAEILARSGAKLPVVEPRVATIVDGLLDGQGAG